MQQPKNISDYRQALKGRILTCAMNMFAKHGIKAVKMDDIASALGISKRTLYEIYANKEVLLFEGIKSHQETQMTAIQDVAAKASNVMDVVMFIYHQKSQELEQTSSLFMDDVQRYPNVLEYLDCERQKYRDVYLKFMERGVKEGFFRPDVNYQLISHLFEALGNHMRRHQLYQQYSSRELFNSLMFVTLRGFCTPKGVQVLDTIMEETSRNDDECD